MSYIPIELKILERQEIKIDKEYLLVSNFTDKIVRVVKLIRIEIYHQHWPLDMVEIEVFQLYRDKIKYNTDTYNDRLRGYGLGWGFRYVV